jgi:hypothetical protein
MKKALLIICVLSVLALLVVSVAAEVGSAGKDVDGQVDPGTVEPGNDRGAGEELDRQMAPDIYPFAKV